MKLQKHHKGNEFLNILKTSKVVLFFNYNQKAKSVLKDSKIILKNNNFNVKILKINTINKLLQKTKYSNLQNLIYGPIFILYSVENKFDSKFSKNTKTVEQLNKLDFIASKVENKFLTKQQFNSSIDLKTILLPNFYQKAENKINNNFLFNINQNKMVLLLQNIKIRNNFIKLLKI